MKEKTPQEQTAAARQVELLVNALKGSSADGYWLNPTGRPLPTIYPKGAKLSPFNALIFSLHADANGYATGLYTTFQDARRSNVAVLKNERAVPMNWYRWANYVNRTNDQDVISREDYLKLTPEQQTAYKAVRQREIRSLFNIEQTTFPMVDQAEYDKLLQWNGGLAARGNIANEEKTNRASVNTFIQNVRDNLVPIRRSTTGEALYDIDKDAVYMPPQSNFEQYPDYVQELMRNVIAATGHRERLAREGVMLHDGKGISESALKYERLVSELASAYKMNELGLPAKLSPESRAIIDSWTQELQENPCMIDALESDVNNALEVIRKAEHGEKIEFASKRTADETSRYQQGQRPQVSPEEMLIMQDILRQGGMDINPANFPGPAEHRAFMEKFNLDYYYGQTRHAIEEAQHIQTDPELINVAYTAAAGEASRLHRMVSELMPRDWELRGSHFISDEVAGIPDKRSKEMVVVFDKATGIADVILPGGARTGGDVVMSNGDKRNFWLTPDEVMLADERKDAGAKVVSSNVPGFNKEKISAALKAQGATYVRFFNTEGQLRYSPDDAYFRDKDVYAAKLNGKELSTTSKLDVSDAVSRATETRFESVRMLKDDDGKWAMYMKPENEPSFAVYPEKEDINRFFATMKMGDVEASNEVRNQLAQKYYAMAQGNPEAKFNLFGTVPDGIDPRQIERVNIFRTKDERIMCAAVITGQQKLAPREMTSQQWQRMWVAEDVAQYKTTLAAMLFADVLRQQTQNKVTDEQQSEDKVIAQPQIAVNYPNMRQYDEMKSKHPDAVLLFRVNDEYQTYNADAAVLKDILDIKPKSVQMPKGKDVDVASFPHEMLDIYLPKLVRSGQRVAICEQLDDPKNQTNRVERGSSEVAAVAEDQHAKIRI